MHSDVNQASYTKAETIRRLTAIARIEADGKYSPDHPMYGIILESTASQVNSSDKDYKHQRRIYNYKHNPSLCMVSWASYVNSSGRCTHPMACGEWRSNCKLCHQTRVDEEMEILRALYATNQQLYYLWIETDRWNTVYKYIKRHKAKYSRIPQPNNWTLVYVNSSLDGRAEECDIDMVNMSAILHDVPLFENISHSKDSKPKGNGNGPAEDEEDGKETKTIKLLQMIHKKYEGDEEATGFAEAMRLAATKVETFEELEKVLNNVLVKYSGIMGRILSSQSIYQTVSQENIDEWNRTVSEYSLSFNVNRNRLDTVKLPDKLLEPELVAA